MKDLSAGLFTVHPDYEPKVLSTVLTKAQVERYSRVALNLRDRITGYPAGPMSGILSELDANIIFAGEADDRFSGTAHLELLHGRSTIANYTNEHNGRDAREHIVSNLPLAADIHAGLAWPSFAGLFREFLVGTIHDHADFRKAAATLTQRTRNPELEGTNAWDLRTSLMTQTGRLSMESVLLLTKQPD